MLPDFCFGLPIWEAEEIQEVKLTSLSKKNWVHVVKNERKYNIEYLDNGKKMKIDN